MAIKLLVLFSCMVVLTLGATDYCKIKCNAGGTHTACKSKCKTAPGTRIIEQTIEFRQAILERHNELRDYLAEGKNISGGNGPAANMRVLSYDMDLEFTCSCWIYSSGFMHHDECRGTAKFEDAGQNIIDGNVFDPTTKKGARFVADSWFSEIVNSTKNQIDKFYPIHGVGHFTQLVWAETTHIGCAMCHLAANNTFMVGCNYGPSGNYNNYSIYIRGDAASQCPKKTQRSKKYPHLCGEPEPMPALAYKVGNPGMKALSGSSRVERTMLLPICTMLAFIALIPC